ncbi:hypothetical protein AKO1_014432 [Acrasis kona]|uniref:Uncharacterized protein n=1 Tax=Acrasis kona TaxID=1008807 RepID=A0AAW2YZW6_9EUKA
MQNVTLWMTELLEKSKATEQSIILTWAILKDLFALNNSIVEPVIFADAEDEEFERFELKWKNCACFINDKEVKVYSLDLSKEPSPFKIREYITVEGKEPSEVAKKACSLIIQALQ